MKKTNCAGCSKVLEYTTKKPLRCDDCKKKKEPKKPSKRKYPSNKNTIGELLLFTVLEEVLPNTEYVNHGFYSFLRSPKGKELQLDRYYPSLRLGFEHQGKPHEEYSRYIHKSRKRFDYYQECDSLKKKACKKHGVTLIETFYNEKLTPELIKEKIKEANPTLYEFLFE